MGKTLLSCNWGRILLQAHGSTICLCLLAIDYLHLHTVPKGTIACIKQQTSCTYASLRCLGTFACRAEHTAPPLGPALAAMSATYLRCSHHHHSSHCRHPPAHLHSAGCAAGSVCGTPQRPAPLSGQCAWPGSGRVWRERYQRRHHHRA